MVHGTRLDCAISSAGLIRQALVKVKIFYFLEINNFKIFFFLIGNLACSSS